ncbi:gustatory receptor 23a-like [Lutzomyia longipalpis]|uniref:gustatory receptor 23a-like n=1 Tax=Lutzomyia longipalpis TaxID=7200 RepID=UPI0024846BBC|nr:gustatory receptor 23a-like [Lutzomyia longipalpis]
MDLLSAIQLSIGIQCAIGVSPFIVRKNHGVVVANKFTIIPGISLFLFNIVSVYFGSQIDIETQAGSAMFDRTLSTGSVLALTMILAEQIHMAFSFTLVYVSNALSAKDFIMVCQVVTHHFRCLQKVLKEAHLEHDELPHRLETFYIIHSDLCDCFDLITENFGAREMSNILSDFIFMTSQLFFAFWSANAFQFVYVIFDLIAILLPRCLKVFYVMYSGEELIRTAHTTSKMLEKLDGPFKRAEFHDLAHNFALQVLHLQDLDITAKNFFSLRLTFLFTLCSACVMYFIVLIQFQLREN